MPFTTGSTGTQSALHNQGNQSASDSRHATAGSFGSLCFIGALDLIDMLSRLPSELQILIYDRAGPATQFVHGRITQSSSPATVSLVWADCFLYDLTGIVYRLPSPQTQLSWELLLVSSDLMRQLINDVTSLHISSDTLTAMSPLNETTAPQFRLLIRQANAHSRLAGQLIFRHFHSKYRNSANKHELDILIATAACLGDNHTVQDVLTRIPASQVDREISNFAAAFGHISIVKLFMQTHPLEISFQGAVSGNQLEIIKYLVNVDPQLVEHISSATVIEMIEHRWNKTLIWLLENTAIGELPCCENIRRDAVVHDNVDVLHFVLARSIGAQLDISWIICSVIKGSVGILECLHNHDPSRVWPVIVVEHAVRCNHVSVLQWMAMVGRFCPNSATMELAVDYDRFEIVVWLHESKGIELPITAMPVQTSRGRLGRYLSERNSSSTITNSE